VSESELGSTDVHIWVVPLDDPDKGRRRALAHRAQRRILAGYLELDPEQVQYEQGAYGKPYLQGGRLQFNLSHSGAVALLAVSRELELGVDVQGPHRTATRPWFARRICTARELEQLGPEPEPAQLLRLWARKEAVIKARGDLSYVSAGEIDVLDDRVDGGWRCLDLEIEQSPTHHAAVALRDRPGVVVLLKTWDPAAEAPEPGRR
jgi:4'-phosphopantetheinyl transferase